MILLVTTAVLTSCESLVQIETPEGLNSITIEADVTTQLRPWEIQITKSQAY